MSKGSVTTTQTISILLIIVAVLVSGVSLNYIMALGGRLGKVEELSTSISGKVEGLGTTVEGLRAAVEELGAVPTPPTPPTPTPPPPPTEKVVLRIAYSQAPRSVDPPDYGDDFLNGIDQLAHESLFRMWYDEMGEVIYQPVLCESYEQVDDLTWEFKIMEGVLFSDGTELDSQDVYWSLFRDDPRPSNQIWSTDARVDHAEIVDKYTIRMITKYPMPNLYAWFCQGWTNIVSYDWVVETDNLHNYPMVGLPPGTGPFMWTECESMLYSKMTRNPFWRGETGGIEYTPTLTDIEIYTAADETARVMAFEAGSFDMIFPTPIEAVDDLEETGYKVLVYPTPIMYALRINNIFPPCDDIRVRKAMAYAINYEELIPSVFGKYATRIRTCVPALGIGYKDFELYDYDQEKAKELIDEYCSDKGIEPPIKVSFYVSAGSAERYVECAAVLKSYFADVGIDLEILLMESAAMSALTIDDRSDYLAGKDVEFDYHLSWRIWHTDTMWSGDDLYSLYYGTTSANTWYFEHEEFDELAVTTVSIAPFEERLEAVYRAQEIWMEECVGIPLHATPYIYTATPKLMNVQVEPNVYPWLAECYYAP